MTAPGHRPHPSREELIRSLSEDDVLVKKHLNECDDCRALYEYLAAYSVAGKPRLTDAPDEVVRLAERIPLTNSNRTTFPALAAIVRFDSWQGSAPAGVRTAGATSERRLRFECEQIEFDLRAERSGRQWHCIGQLTSAKLEVSGFRVEVQNRPIELNDDGFFQWSSTVPPRHVRLLSDDLVIDLPEISWKSRPQN